MDCAAGKYSNPVAGTWVTSCTDCVTGKTSNTGATECFLASYDAVDVDFCSDGGYGALDTAASCEAAANSISGYTWGGSISTQTDAPNCIVKSADSYSTVYFNTYYLTDDEAEDAGYTCSSDDNCICIDGDVDPSDDGQDDGQDDGPDDSAAQVTAALRSITGALQRTV